MEQTRLYEEHLALGGRMVPFAGYELPVQYRAGPTEEHAAVRTVAGLFDIDHMGQFRLRGADALDFLQYVQVYDVSQMEVWDAHYSLLLYEDGGIVDDIFLYRLPTSWLIVVNAANRSKDLRWLRAHAAGYRIELEDASDSTYMLALQGPEAEAILSELTEADLSALAARRALETGVAGVTALVGRTGYTGEDGFELYFDPDRAVSVWRALLEAGRGAGCLPCGLAARDSLRFEACMPLYGHEIDAMTDPVSARLSWVLSLEKPDFIGRQALWKASLESREQLLVGFEMVDRAVAREGYPIVWQGAEIGRVTSGMKSPTLDKFLGLGYVRNGHHRIGDEIEVLVRDRPKRAVIVKRPFYRAQYKS